MVEKFPYKKHLDLDWHEAAIGYLLFFKNLKEKYNNNIYFLVSEKGITLKANTPTILKQAEEDVNKFYKISKIELLDTSYSSKFYDNVLEDIKYYTAKLKDTKDCPYIHLVYSEKLKQSCLSLKNFKYSKPYECWEEQERERKGFAYLIVRPDYRWKEVANAVYNIVNKREASVVKTVSRAQPKIWVIELPFEKFIWIYFKKEFKEYKDMIDIKDSKNENMICIGVSNQLPYMTELEKQIDNLNYQIIESPPTNLKELAHGTQVVVLAALELERIIENLYHEFGLSNQLRRIKHLNNNSCLIVGPIDVELWMSKKEESFNRQHQPELTKLQSSAVKFIERYGRNHQIVQYEGNRYLSRQYEKPLKPNIAKQLTINSPSTPGFFFYYEKDNSLFLLRHYYFKQFYPHFKEASPLSKLFLMETLSQVLLHLHKNDIVAGTPFKDCIYIEGDNMVIDCKEEGEVAADIQEFKRYLQETVDLYKPVDHTEELAIVNIQQHLSKEFNLSKLTDTLHSFRCLFL